MRLQLNLNQYYNGLNDYQVNQLFCLFMNMKSNVRAIDQGLKESYPETSLAFQLTKTKVISGCRSIDDFMENLEREPIFEIKKQLKECNDDYSKINIQSIIDKYNYLMEKSIKA